MYVATDVMANLNIVLVKHLIAKAQFAIVVDLDRLYLGKLTFWELHLQQLDVSLNIDCVRVSFSAYR